MLRPLSTLWCITFTLQMQMTSAPLIQVTKDYGSIFASKIPIITRLSRMEDQYALTYPDLSSSAPLGSSDKHLWLFIHFSKTYNNHTWQNGRPVSNNFILQVMMRLELNRTNYLMKKSTVTRNSI